MPVNATFTADFSNFLKAVDMAEVALVDFGKGASTVEKSLNKMVDNFSGRKIIQEAHLLTIAVEEAGGIAKLTAKELDQVGAKANEAAEKMKKLGYEVPKGLQDLADATKHVEGGVSGMSSAVASFAGNLGAMALAKATEMAIEFGKAAFVTADQLVTLSARTGISIEALQTFQAVGDDTSVSLDTMANAVNTLQERLGKGDKGAAAGIEALGINLGTFLKLDPAQQFIQIANAIKEIKDPIEFARVASELFGKNWKELAPALKQGFDEAALASQGMGATTARVLDEAGDKWNAHTRWLKGQWAEAMADIVTGTTSAFRAAQDEYTKFVNAVVAAAPKLNVAAALAPPGLPADIDAITKKFDEQAKQITEQNSPAMIAFKAGMDAISLAGTGWVTVLDTIDGKVVEAIKYYLEAGVAQTALAAAYGLTATQIAAVDAARKNELAGASAEESMRQRRLELTKLQTQATNDAVIAQLKQNQANDDFLKTELEAAQAEDAATAAFWKAREAKEKNTESTDKLTKATGVYMNQLHMLVDDPKLAAFFGNTAQGSVANTLYGGGANGMTPEMAAAIAAGQFINTAGVGMPHRAAGGPVTAGQPYLVGEKGPELFVPGKSGSIATGAGGVTNTFYVNGTAQETARAIADILTRQIMQGRKLSGS